MFVALSLGGGGKTQFVQLLYCLVFALRDIVLRSPQYLLLALVSSQRRLFCSQFVFQFCNAFVCGLDLSGQRSLLRANLGLLLFALLQFSRKKKNSVVAIGFFTLHRFVISTGFFQLAARFFQRCSGVVAFVKQSVPLLADLRTLPVQVRHSRFAFE